MSKVLRLITDEVTIFSPSQTSTDTFTDTKSHILYKPQGIFTILGFTSHLKDRSTIHPFAQEAINNNIGLVYMCDKMPQNPIHSNNIIYLVCPNAWMIHTLFFDPLQFSAVFYSKSYVNLAKAFSVFTGYNIPMFFKLKDIYRQASKYKKCNKNIVVEINGGVGDHLLTIPTLKTLDSQGYRVHVVCEQHRQVCFENLPYVRGMFDKRSDVSLGNFEKVYYLHFGQNLNDYRLDVNKQNRIYAIANMCGLSKEDLVIDRPEIILSKLEKDTISKKYSVYNNKVFVGSDSARIDAKLPSDLTQNVINFLKRTACTVFSASNRRHSFNNCIDLNKGLSLRELFALIDLMDFVFTVDTSFLHIAAAFNKPTICLMSYFNKDWRCSTYKNTTVITPNVSCYPCGAFQFKSQCERKCTQKSCYNFYDWDNINSTLLSSIRVVSSEVKNIPNKQFSEQDLPGKLISYRENTSKRIAAMWLGGIGDAVMLGCLARSIKRKFGNCFIDVFVRDIEQVQLFLFDYPNIKAHISKDTWGNTANILKRSYDLVYEFRPYSCVWEKGKDIEDFNSDLYDNWSKATEVVLENSTKQTFRYYADKTDLEILPEDLKIPLVNNKHYVDSLLLKYSLPNNYITISSGCDKNVGIMKLWGKDKWLSLVDKLKSRGKNIVQLGNEMDVNLPGISKLNCESLVDLMYILNRSTLHISNEGGLVHLAHALGTKSAVLFGATTPTLFGYEDNINIYIDNCPSCWWKRSDWSKKCMLGNKSCINLDALSVDNVFTKIEGDL